MKPLELAADCSRCAALCCVLLPFQAASGFGVDKPGGRACHNLGGDDRCTIHASLRDSGWPGCTVFDCFGAGQHMTESTYAGTSWRDPSVDRGEMAAVLTVMRMLHEAVGHLLEAQRRAPAVEVAALAERVTALTDGTPVELLTLDLDGVMGEVGAVLRKASDRLRGSGRPAFARADLAGKDLRRRELRGADLHGSMMIAADLRGCDLSAADVLGADLRDADVRGAKLADVLFLTQSQVNAMVGDSGTTLPGSLNRPGHWQPHLPRSRSAQE